MLVLSRKVGERILLGDKIRITVVRVSGGGVRLGIEAPADIPVVREEVVLENDVTEVSAAGERLGKPLPLNLSGDTPPSEAG